MRSNTASYQTSLEQKRSELLNRAHKREDIHIEQAADKLDELQLQLNRELVIRELQVGASILRQVESALARIESASLASVSVVTATFRRDGWQSCPGLLIVLCANNRWIDLRMSTSLRVTW